MKIKFAFYVLFQFCIFNIVFGQTSNFESDSVITYDLLLKDTSSKINNKKETFEYSTNHKLTKKTSYQWNASQNQWIKQFSYKISHHNKETLIEKYQIENQKQEILVGRTIVSFDSLSNLFKEATVYSKERYSDKYVRREQYIYIYEKRQIKKVEHYKQGSTFFKESERNINWLKNKIVAIEHSFVETNQKPIRSIKKQYDLINDTIKKIRYQDSSKYILTFSDSIIHLSSSKLIKYQQPSISVTNGKSSNYSIITSTAALKDKSITKVIILIQCDNKQACQGDQLKYFYINNSRFNWKMDVENFTLFDLISE